MRRTSRGFTLLELMVAMVLGLLLSSGVYSFLIGNKQAEAVNQALASVQEQGRYALSLLRRDLQLAGMYDAFDPSLDDVAGTLDVADELNFVTEHSVLLPGDVDEAGIGSVDGGAGTDTLVIGYLGDRDCGGSTHGYGGLFYLVNRYWLEDGTLYCQGLNGRNLRAGGNGENSDSSQNKALLNNIVDFQVSYGVNRPDNTLPIPYTGQPNSYVNAANLPAEMLAGAEVVAVRIALLVRSDVALNQSVEREFKLLGQAKEGYEDGFVYKQFETTIVLRNNFNRITMGYRDG